jgi:AraC-like DNA-binding protein
VLRVEDVDAWQRRVATAFARAEIEPADARFSGRMRTFARDGVRLSRLSATSHRLERRPKHMAAHEPGRYVVCLQTAGRGIVEQDGRTAALGAGDVTIYDTSRPYTLRFDGPFTCVGVAVPDDALSVRPGAMASLSALAMSATDPVTTVVNDGILALEEGVAGLPPFAQDRVTHGIVDLVETLCVHHASRAGGLAGGGSRAVQFDAVLRFIDEHLGDPGLDPRMIAAAHHVSVRALHDLARASGVSIAAWIRSRRLERCRADLANPALASLSVAAIGARWGLLHQPHFTTLFRTRFGVTPGAYRRAGLHGLETTLR